MGIKNLSKLLKDIATDAIKEITLEDLRGHKVTVDVQNYLYQYVYKSDQKGKGSHIRGFFEMIVAFRKHNITPIFIFDGKPSKAKQGTLKDRRNVKDSKYEKMAALAKDIVELISPEVNIVSAGEIIKEESDEVIELEDILMNAPDLPAEKIQQIAAKQEQITNIKKTIINIRRDMITDIQQLFDLSGIPYLEASSEADFLCSKLVKEGIAAATISEDMDMLTHGSTRLVRGINEMNFRRKGSLKQFSLDVILEKSELTMDQFVNMCILCGCDYCDTPNGVGPKTAFKSVKQYGNLEDILMIIEKTGKLCGRDVTIPERGIDYVTALNEFKKSDAETMPDSSFECKNPHRDLMNFLLRTTNYTKKTLTRKISEISCLSLSSVSASEKSFTVVSKSKPIASSILDKRPEVSPSSVIPKTQIQIHPKAKVVRKTIMTPTLTSKKKISIHIKPKPT